eukprot:132866-Prymnesium_polylepis.1
MASEMAERGGPTCTGMDRSKQRIVLVSTCNYPPGGALRRGGVFLVSEQTGDVKECRPDTCIFYMGFRGFATDIR